VSLNTERQALVHEDCRHCGKPSHQAHPGGVIAGRWKCPDWGCGRWQHEATLATENESLPACPECGAHHGPAACHSSVTFTTTQLEGD